MATVVQISPTTCDRCGAVSTRAGAQFCAACGRPLKAGSGWWTAAIVGGSLVTILALAAFFFVGTGRRSIVPATSSAVAGISVDLSSAPQALLQGGPPADQMSLNGLSLGSPLAMDRRIDGNEFLVADGRVSQIAIGRSDLLRACGVRGERDIERQFGDEPSGVQRDGAFASYDYAERGITVEWDARLRQLNRIILRPATHD